ncbi:hypothetical protein [Sphingomonas sp. 3-13AW]|uniref:hypothetical protein n=1 Tax=Sphingomonas sp. 3-13AW TaxID=3050450 RepID=UPI003BB5D9D0
MADDTGMAVKLVQAMLLELEQSDPERLARIGVALALMRGRGREMPAKDRKELDRAGEFIAALLPSEEYAVNAWPEPPVRTG